MLSPRVMEGEKSWIPGSTPPGQNTYGPLDVPNGPSISVPNTQYDFTVPSADQFGVPPDYTAQVMNPGAITDTGAVQTGFEQLLAQPFKPSDPLAASEEFKALLARSPASEFEQLLQRAWQPEGFLSAEATAALESQGLSVLGAVADIAGLGALVLAPGSLSPSDAPLVGPFTGDPAALGPGASFLNPDMAFTNNPPPNDVQNPTWLNPLKPETAHPPAPLPQSIPVFNPQLWSLPLPGPKPIASPLTGIQTALAPFTNPGGNPRPSGRPGASPAPSPKPKAGPRGSAQTVSRDCNQGKRPGRCRQGYFREQTDGTLELITWSTRKCP